ncbi:MAG: 3' terminal RNA ribose 2'-O-methyltransferase Hen1 [Candidatus Protochlamydia sp.]|nr:3' terminal RNA ribose 2'-O-methyltransferase Hen1 [Candidatus Protochlamydia sp.]
MMISISMTHQPASDLGYLLHKNPNKIHEISLSFGKATIFYPHATQEYCEAVLLVDLDPIALVRPSGHSAKASFALQPYVNDRPYVASSFTSVALMRAFRPALKGSSRERPELAASEIPLKVVIPVLPCKGGAAMVRKLFSPLGYRVETAPITHDETFSDWGDSNYLSVTLTHTCLLKDFLTHLYVLLPVLDNEKHYWIGEDELEKLLAHGEGWLKEHPEMQLITSRYLRQQRYLIDDAFERLLEDGESVRETEVKELPEERKIRLHDMRLETIVEELKSLGVNSVIDMGCGSGKLLKRLMKIKSLQKIAGMDVCLTELQRAKTSLRLDELSEEKQPRVQLFLGSLMYRDSRLKSYDAAVVSEVIEHLEPYALDAFKKVVFDCAKPRYVIITTPNFEYNCEFEDLPPGKFRHSDHRFEWTRQQFQDWCREICHHYGYQVQFKGLGPVHPERGAPSQMALFKL